MKTGKTGGATSPHRFDDWPQWSPVMKTGKTPMAAALLNPENGAAMEPGHEDREDSRRGSVGCP